MRTINTLNRDRIKAHNAWMKSCLKEESPKDRLQSKRIWKMRSQTKRAKYRSWTPLQHIVGNRFGANPLRTARNENEPVLKSPSRKWLELKKYIKYAQLPAGFNVANLNPQIAKMEANPRRNLHSTAHDWRECWNPKGQRSITMNPLVSASSEFQFKIYWMRYNYWEDDGTE